MPLIKSIAFPDPDLMRAAGPLPKGLHGFVWNFMNTSDGVHEDGVDAVILPYIGAAHALPKLSAIPNLKFVQAQSTGFEDVIAAVHDGIGVANASGVHAAATAELAIGLILAKLRGIDTAARNQNDAAWQPARYPGLADRKVLLIGAGGIGNEIMRRLQTFEVEITRVGSTARSDKSGLVHGPAELLALAPNNDVVVVVTPLTTSTYHLINAEFLARLPNGALVVNVGRGPVVDTAALTQEVLSGRLHCALDVVDPEPFPRDHPLWGSPNALITPHVGGNTDAFTPRIVKLITSQLEALANNSIPANMVQLGPFAAL